MSLTGVFWKICFPGLKNYQSTYENRKSRTQQAAHNCGPIIAKVRAIERLPGQDRLPPIILYHYTEIRAGGNTADFLDGIEEGSYVMVDAYSGYNRLKKIRRYCCYAHIRRYLMEAIPKGQEKDYSHPAVQGVLYCNKLFEYERSYKEKGLSYAQVYKRRQKDAKPVVEGFMRWLDGQHPEKGSRMDRAVTYIRNRNDTLMTYLEDGRCSLSNNPSENSLRPVTLGRKNWLFSDSPDGANASMVVYTMVEMAKAYGPHRCRTQRSCAVE